jgi:hypothetical protein
MACCNGNALCVVPGNDTPGHPCKKATDAEFATAIARERASQRGTTSSEEAARQYVEAARATEERLAWDRYAAAATANGRVVSAAADADELLEERRKRFGSSVK